MSIIKLKPFEVNVSELLWRDKPVKELSRSELLTAFVETVSLLIEERRNLASTSRLLEFYLTNANEGITEDAASETNFADLIRLYDANGDLSSS